MSAELETRTEPVVAVLDPPRRQAASPVAAIEVEPVRRPRWESRYALLVAISDLAAVVVSSALYAVWGSAQSWQVAAVGAVMVGLAAVCLSIARAWEPAVLGQGSVEFTRLTRGLLAAAITVGLVSLAAQLPEGRPWAFGVVPVAWLLAAAGRKGMRRWLHRRRTSGAAMLKVLAVGTHETISSLVNRTRRTPHFGWSIVGACTPTGRGSDGTAAIEGVEVVGDLDAIGGLAIGRGYHVISISQSPEWTPQRLQQLAWDLEGTSVELVVDPGLMEIAGPRLHVAAVDGLPMLRLSQPAFTGASRLLKGVIDRVGAVLLIGLLAPVLLALAMGVRSDGGPVFFRQTRVGKDGREFRMVKFRSMVVDAERRLAALQAVDDGNGTMFKMRSDPRITPFGRILRKHSLDELPQLFNVLGGSMSLVGPRPPLPVEVAGYGRDAHRRLLVKPGMTGLWQVSGRSDLSWDETVRLDLRYVENWTLALDAQILLMTFRAVVRGGGAY